MKNQITKLLVVLKLLKVTISSEAQTTDDATGFNNSMTQQKIYLFNFMNLQNKEKLFELKPRSNKTQIKEMFDQAIENRNPL